MSNQVPINVIQQGDRVLIPEALCSLTSPRDASQVRTVITFDKGGVWGYLRPPKVDAAGNALKCTADDCSLHLHGVTDTWGPFYSSANSLGLIMATGNVGSSLSNYEDEINT